MNEPRIFLVHLRRPQDKYDLRDDPFYERGSFGCTTCHHSNLLHPRHAKELIGARLGFIQGGPRGSRLVFLTPPIKKVLTWTNPDGTRFCEVKWTKGEMPFKYSEAPILVWNHHTSDFPSIKKLAGAARCPSLESGLASLFRSRANELESEEAKQVESNYDRHRKDKSPSGIASKYYQALPNYRHIDDKDGTRDERAKRYHLFHKGLRADTDGVESTLDKRAVARKTKGPCVRHASRCRK